MNSIALETLTDKQLIGVFCAIKDKEYWQVKGLFEALQTEVDTKYARTALIHGIVKVIAIYPK
jgi:hypothetical protein